MFKSNELPRKGKKTNRAAEQAANKQIADDRAKVGELARKIKKTEDGSYTTQTYDRFQKLGKKWPKVEKSEELVKKWASLLSDIEPKHQMEAARALEMEARALRDLSDQERSLNVGPMLKFVFPAITRYFSRLS